jgi:hypothetical protein
MHKMPLESSIWRRCQNSLRMLKNAAQQGRSERRGEAYASVRCASERRENAAGGLFQHPARNGGLAETDILGESRDQRQETNWEIMALLWVR